MKKKFSFHVDLDSFIPATDAEKEYLVQMRPSSTFFKDGVKRIAQKVGEESLEAVIEACTGTNEQLTYEAADMLYHLIVLLAAKGMRIEELAEELHRRHDPEWDKKCREAKAAGTMK